MSPLDPVLLVAHAMRTSPGIYGLLLGSGISSGAAIPTGWAITLDLIQRVATAQDGSEPEDLEGWYNENIGGSPDYSELLDRLGPTSAERQAIIRRYVEPTPDERDQELKAPTQAHRAIASLVDHGYIRVIMTTNFDRLMEQALNDLGIDFDVVASVDAIAGVRPLGQAPCLVIKLNGDYRDARIRNTEAELSSYPPEMDVLLNRILDEYGLIVSGWSATWDPALREAILRQPNRRYSMWWVAHGSVSSEAQEVIASRRATVVEGMDADLFFGTLVAKVEALEQVDRPHPLTVSTAVAELKSYLRDPTKQIRQRDLIMGETERLHAAIADEKFPVQGNLSVPELHQRLQRYEATAETLMHLFVIGSRWTDDPGLYGESLERISNSSDPWGGSTLLLHLRRYPALLLLYAGGIAAIYAERWQVLRSLTNDGTFRHPNKNFPLVVALNNWEVFGGREEAQWLPDQERKHTPGSNYLFERVRQPLRELIPDDGRFQATFDRFEYLLGLITHDHHERGDAFTWVAPVGCFGWRHEYRFGQSLGDAIRSEAEEAGTNWGPLRVGLFNGSSERLESVLSGYEELVNGANSRWL